MTWAREDGPFHPAADQHLWHLKERCRATGEERNCGIMAIYVDDVLLAADAKTAHGALQAIASVWECAPAEQATLQASVTFCGFEIQRNDAQLGGGFWMHQRSYEKELVKKWDIKEMRHHLDFKLPTPEEEAEFQRSEHAEAAFSDISFASSKGYRSVQGQVYYYAGAPVMWNTNSQPFPTQSTAESELAGLCEALVGGRAPASLVAAIRNEPEEKLIKRLWGDNAAAISLATGEGRELVADSFTKIVDGAAFERALQDLGIAAEVKKINGDGGGRSDLVGAREDEETSELSWLWTLGVILMSVGAVYVSSKIVRSGIWLYNRLVESSGSRGGEEVKGRGESPQLRMLRRSAENEGTEERGRVNQQQATYASPANVQEIQEMVTQSQAAQREPHNKMHGRDVTKWSSSDEDEEPRRAVKLHTGDQLPRRRKKKGKGGKLKTEETVDETVLEREWLAVLGTTRNLHGGASSKSRVPQSGYSSVAKGSSSKGMTSQSGSSDVAH
eukprot:s1543_g1.t1